MDWPFFFWDDLNHCILNPKLERMYKVQTNVFIIAIEEGGSLGYKYRQHNNGGFSSEVHKEIFPPLSMQGRRYCASEERGAGILRAGSRNFCQSLINIEILLKIEI